jgi:hypothetical protein
MIERTTVSDVFNSTVKSADYSDFYFTYYYHNLLKLDNLINKVKYIFIWEIPAFK